MGLKLLNALLIVAALSLILALAGEMDHREAQDEALIYQTMVCEGTWPDYKNLAPRCEQ